MKKEIWKDIKEYESLYQVSNLGNVRSIKFKKIRILKQHIDKDGYLRIILYKHGNPKNYLVHRLVAETFIPNPKNLPQINHIKEFEKVNNRVDNLEWCTCKYNCNYGTRTKRGTTTNKKKILQYDKKGILIKKWDGIIDAEVELNITHQHIIHCLKGRCKTAGGYIWRYY